MNRRDNGLQRKYFEWLCSFVYDHSVRKNVSYSKLLKKLDSVEFIYTIDLDGNRYEDGVNLRHRYLYELGYEEDSIDEHMDFKRPCSVLEMMVALSIRCEEEIMEDTDVGNRTGQWFWGMIINLGINRLDDYSYDETIVDDILHTLLYREYNPNGAGGLFTVENSRSDMREVDIWYQMCWYLNTII